MPCTPPRRAPADGRSCRPAEPKGATLADIPNVLDHPLIGQRYFFPRRDAVEPCAVVVNDGGELRGSQHTPHPGAPTVLHFHGNGEVVADWVPELPRALEARGLNCFLAEYRGYGGSGGEPQLAAMLDDAVAAFDQLTGPVIVYGRSVGSIYARHVAAEREAAALLIESGIADVRERLLLRVTPEELGVSAAERDEAIDAQLNHQRKMGQHAGPVTVLHAVQDHLVDVSHGERLAAWAGQRGRLCLYERGDHRTIHMFNGAALLDEVAVLAATLD